MSNLPPQINTAWINKFMTLCGDCAVCLSAKAKQVAVPVAKAERVPIIRAGQLVASDLMTFDNNDETAFNGHRYIIFFFDAFTRILMAMPLKTRDEIPSAIAMAIDKFKLYGHKIEVLQSDNEYVSAEIEALQGAFGFRPRFSCPIESKFQNGMAEKNVQDIKNRLRSALANAHPSFPKKAWTSALQFSVKIRNITTVCSDKTASAYTAFTGTMLSFPDITVIGFGRICKILTKGNNEGALDERAVTGWYIGPKLNSKNVCEFLTLDGGRPEYVSSIIGRRSFWPLTEIGLASMKPALPLDATIPMSSRPLVHGEEIMSMDDQGSAENSLPKIKLSPELILPPISAQDFLSAHTSRKAANRLRLVNIRNAKIEAKAIEKARTAETTKIALTKRALDKASAAAKAKLKREENQRNQALQPKTAIAVHKLKTNIESREDRIERARVAREQETSQRNLDRVNRQNIAKAKIAKIRLERVEAQALKLSMERDRLLIRSQAQASDMNNQWSKVQTRRQIRFEKAQRNSDLKITANLVMAHQDMFSSLTNLSDPKGHKAMLKTPDAELFLIAQEDEMRINFHGKGTGEKVNRKDIPAGTKILHTMFSYRRKFLQDTGALDKHKARLLVLGNEEEEFDDADNYAPTAQTDTIRTVLKIAQAEDVDVDTADIEGAFLAEFMPSDREPVYIQLPLHLTHGVPEYYKLKRSLYGLRSAPKIFYDGLSNHLVKHGYAKCPFDPCVYRKVVELKYITIVAHVDDMLIISNCNNMRENFKKDLALKYKSVYKSNATTFVGLSITRDRAQKTLKISQSVYASHILKTLNMENAIASDTPANHLPFTGTSAGPGDQSRLRQITGLLQYLTMTRPDIVVALNKVSKKQCSPTAEDMIAAHKIVRYVAGTLDYGITYSGSDTTLIGSADASFANESNFRSRSGHCFTLGDSNGVISFHSSVQTLTAQSTQEAEVIALNECSRDLAHFRQLLTFLGHSQSTPTRLKEDNNGALAFATGRGSQDRTRHIGVRYHYIKDQVQNGISIVEYVDTKLQLADIFTKILLPENHSTQVSRIMGTL